jgi:hypothetical protein
MPITVHPDLEAKIRARAEAEGGLTVEAYVDRLIREEDSEIAQTEALLQEAAASGEHLALTEGEWDRMEQEARAALEANRRD